MATESIAAKITLGAALGGSFTSALGQASRSVGDLAKQIRTLEGAQAKFRLIDDIAGRMPSIEAEVKKLAAEKDAAYRAKVAADLAAKKGGKAEELAAVEATIALKKSTDALRAKAAEYDKLAAKATRAQRATESVDKATLSHALDVLNARQHLAESKDRLETAKTSLLDSWRSTVTWASLTVGVAAGALYKLGSTVAHDAEELHSMAERLGMTTRALQTMQYAGLRNNLTIEETTDLLGKLQVRLADAAAGQGPETINALRWLKLNPFALSTMPPDEAVMKISEALQGVADPAQRAALAVQLMGKEGAKMANLLAQGPQEIARLRKEAELTGFVMSKELVESGRAFDAAMKRLGAVFTGVRNILASDLLPALTELASALTGVLLDNLGFFKDTAHLLGDVIRASAPTVIFFANSLIFLGQVFGTIFAPAFRLMDALGIWPVFVTLLAGGAGILLVTRLVAIGKAIAGIVTAQRDLAVVSSANGVLSLLFGGKAAASALAALPLGTRIWAVAMKGIGALLKFGAVFLGIGETVVTWLGTAGTLVSGLFSGAMASVGAFFSGLLPTLGTMFMGTLSAIGSALVAFITSVPVLIAAAFATGFGIGKLLLKLKPVLNFAYAIGDAIFWVWEKISAGFNWLWEKAGKLFSFLGKIAEKAKGLWGKKEAGKNGADKPGKAGLSDSPFDNSAGGIRPTRISTTPTASEIRGKTDAQNTAPVSITVHAAPGQSEDAIARKTADLIESRNRRTSAASYRGS